MHVVLHEPEIPNNTGTIGRLCVGVGAALHLVHPLGFDVGDRACRRAGLDYWPRLDVREHASFDAYERMRPADAGLWVLTTQARRPLFDVTLRAGDHFLFGKESGGLPGSILERHPDRLVCLPMVAGERSQNLANAASVAVYEAVRQLLARGVVRQGPSGRLERDF